MSFLTQSSRWSDLAATFTVALQCARRDGDPAGRARILSILAYALGNLERHDEALELADHAEALAASGEHRAATDCLEEALPLARKAAMPYIEAYVLNALGMAHDSNGTSTEAAGLLTDAAHFRAAIADRAGQAESLLHLSRTLTRLNRPTEAEATWSQASALVDELATPKLLDLREAVAHHRRTLTR